MMEYCAAERKKELLTLVTAWIELESIMLSEISQAVNFVFLKWTNLFWKKANIYIIIQKFPANELGSFYFFS